MFPHRRVTLCVATLSKALKTVCHRSTSTISKQHSVYDNLLTKISPTRLQQKFANPLRNRKFLPGSHSEGVPEFLASPREGLPFALKWEAADQWSARQLAQKSRQVLDDVLPEYGVVLFRGLPFDGARGFGEFCDSLGYQPMGYKGGTGNRSGIDGVERVYVSTEDPHTFSNELHNEMACSPVYPKKVIFYCLRAPDEGCGGLTPFARNSEVFSRLDKDVVRRLEERKIRYTRYLPDESARLYTSWQQSFYTEDKTEVEEFLKNASFNYEWLPSDGGSLSYWYVLPPTMPHPVSGLPIWFTQPHVHHNTYYKESPMFEGSQLENHRYPTHTTYGDGEEFEPEVIQHVRDIGWQCAVGFDWRKGDLMVLDNLLAMHGKLSFTGERKILAYLTGN